MYLKEKKVVFKVLLKFIELKIIDFVLIRYWMVENFNKLKKIMDCIKLLVWS